MPVDMPPGPGVAPLNALRSGHGTNLSPIVNPSDGEGNGKVGAGPCPAVCGVKNGFTLLYNACQGEKSDIDALFVTGRD